MKILTTRFFSEFENLDTLPSKLDLLITDVKGIDIDKWVEQVKEISPASVIPPFDIRDPSRTSRCADLAKMRIEHVGVVVCGKSEVERTEFFLWAQEQCYAPIVLLPHKMFTRQRQIMQLSVPKYINKDTWIHLPEPLWDFDETEWPGIYTTGEEI